MNDANSWATTSAFTELDAEANDKGGNLNATWDTCKDGSVNGIDH